MMLGHIVAAFTVPMEMPNDAWSFLYIVPLVIALSVVYKTTKIRAFTWYALARESAILIASIMVFMAVVAGSIYALCAVILR